MKIINGQTYYTQQDIQDNLHVSNYMLRMSIVNGFIPRPYAEIITLGKCYYTQAEYEEIKLYFSNNKKGTYLTFKDMALIIKTTIFMLRTAVEQGLVPPPTHQQSSIRKYYIESDIPIVKKAFEKRTIRRKNDSLHKVKAQGYLTGCDCAKILNMPEITYRSLINKGVIKRPKHRIEGRFYKFYTMADVEEIKLALHNYGYVSRGRKPRKNTIRKQND